MPRNPKEAEATTKSESRSYKLDLQFEPRIAAEHLGSHKYSKNTRALGELVANALDAGANLVEIGIQENELLRTKSIFVKDDGKGISPSVLKERFVIVGVDPGRRQDPTLFARFGVGRLAVFRIGSLSRWTTVSRGSDGRCTKLMFSLRSDDPTKLEIVEEGLPKSEKTGTHIEITNLRDSGTEALTPANIAAEMVSQFCSFLLGNPSKTIRVQDDTLDVAKLVVRRDQETLPKTDEMPEAKVDHYTLTRPVERSRFPAQLLFTSRGRTVAAVQPEEPPSPQYLGLVDCPYLNEIVAANRESIIEMDSGFAALKSSALQVVKRYGERLRAGEKQRFIERARLETYYPFKGVTADPVAGVQQALYDVVLEKVHEQVNFDSMTKKQQAVIFRLLQRSLDNENLLDVLHQVVELSDEDVGKFSRVLEHTTLGSIISLSSEVTGRLSFLDVLHELVYGEVAKHLKERTQLHRIIESHCWAFGSQFHLAASDKSFRQIVRRHRNLAGLPDIDDDSVAGINGVNDIPDLFMAASRDYPTDPKHHHVLVELKAPSVRLGRTQVEQIRRYAQTILESSEFDKKSTHWDLFLVSAKALPEIDLDRKQKDKPVNCLYQWESMTVWACEWSELITRAREEMQLVRDHLQRKSKELSVSEYLRENFPEILANLSSGMPKTGETPPPPDALKEPPESIPTSPA
jgi:hypothetical protein